MDQQPLSRFLGVGGFVLGALALLLAIYMHAEVRRFDVVLTSAGSGGSQTETGSTDTTGYLVDHKTGRVWELNRKIAEPLIRLPCIDSPNIRETEHGCQAISRIAPPEQKR